MTYPHCPLVCLSFHLHYYPSLTLCCFSDFNACIGNPCSEAGAQCRDLPPPARNSPAGAWLLVFFLCASESSSTRVSQSQIHGQYRRTSESLATAYGKIDWKFAFDSRMELLLESPLSRSSQTRLRNDLCIPEIRRVCLYYVHAGRVLLFASVHFRLCLLSLVSLTYPHTFFPCVLISLPSFFLRSASLPPPHYISLIYC